MQLALGTVTVISLLMTVAMGIVTWRLLRDERRRSAARLSLLARRLREHETETVETLDPDPDGAGRLDLPFPGTGTGAARARRELQPGHLGLAGLGLTACGVAAIVVVTLLPVGDPDGTAIDPVPLELLALEHDRQEGRLAITGAVRNPPHGAPQPRLSVLATAFDDGGTVIATGRSPVGDESLPAGGEAAFTLSLPAETATRYRISFMVDEGTVPHLDRRPSGVTSAHGDDEEPAGETDS